MATPRDIPVLVEPQAGHSDDEVAAALESCGAKSVEILAPGFISAYAPAEALSQLEAIAHVHRKAKKRMRKR